MPNPVTERFLKAFVYLRNRGMVSSQKEFAEKLQFPESYFPGLRSGERNIQLSQISNLSIIFGVSLYYLLIGRYPIMEEDAQKELAPELLRQLEEERRKRELVEKEKEQLIKQVEFYQKLIKDYLKP